MKRFIVLSVVLLVSCTAASAFTSTCDEKVKFVSDVADFSEYVEHIKIVSFDGNFDLVAILPEQVNVPNFVNDKKFVFAGLVVRLGSDVEKRIRGPTYFDRNRKYLLSRL